MKLSCSFFQIDEIKHGVPQLNLSNDDDEGRVNIVCRKGYCQTFQFGLFYAKFLSSTNEIAVKTSCENWCLLTRRILLTVIDVELSPGGSFDRNVDYIFSLAAQ